MRILRRTLAALVLSLWVAPAAAHADVIQCVQPADAACQIIGEFVWSRDSFFGFGDILALNNLSSATTVAGAFTDIALTADPAVDPGHLFPSPTLDTGGFPLESGSLFDVESAIVTFMFGNAAFTSSLVAADLFDDGFGTAFASTLIYAQDVPASVPEPSTLLLIGAGLIGARLSRRTPKVR
jgi:hypothetical protein